MRYEPGQRRTVSSLREIWVDPDRRLRLMQDCCALIDQEVAGKKGLKGATLRGAYKAVKRVKPGIIGYVLGKLLPDFLDVLEPTYQECITKAASNSRTVTELFSENLCEDPERVADMLLDVTDRRIDEARAPIKVAYSTVRGEALNHVTEAIPGLAARLATHLTL